MLVGRRPVSPDELAARFLARLVDDVARREGGVAARVAVTHPASWGPHRMGALHAALAEQGLGSAMLVAGAGGRGGRVRRRRAGRARRDRRGLRPGRRPVRCDGGAARARRVHDRGHARGRREVRGSDLDEVVLAHVREALGPAWEALDPADPEVLAAVADLRRGWHAAKEALSHDTEVLVPVVLPGVRTQVRLGRAEFEEMIRPALAETVEAMRRALDGAGTSARGPRGAGAGRRLVADPAGAAAGVGGVRARRDRGAGPAGRGRGGCGAGGGRAGPDVGRAEARRPGRPSPGRGAPDPVPAAVGASALGAAVGADAVSPAGAPARGGAGRGPAGRPDGSAGPGTLPLVAGRAPGSPDGTEVLAVARPPKQARPFLADTPPTTSRPRRIALFASAGALTLAALGGVVAFGIERIGAGAEAGAVTPAGSSVTDTSASPPSVTTVLVETPAPKAPPPPPPPRRGNRAAPTTTNAPPRVTTAPPTAPEVTEEPAETAPPEETAPPQNDGGGGAGGGAGDDQGAGAGEEAGAASAAGTGDEQGAAEANVAAPADSDGPDAEGTQDD